MNDKRILLGVITTFLGIIVPVVHHVLLYNAMAGRPSSNYISDMRSVFASLPWIDWAYLAFMLAVGVTLVVSGLLNRPAATSASQPAPATKVGPRGFEVVPNATRE
jgi:uncharacterized protein (DUF58 family)